MHVRHALSVLVVVTLLPLAASARGEGPAEPLPTEPSPTERRVEFNADRVELDASGDRVELEGNVAVVADRYRLTSDHLLVDKTSHGLVVEGAGRIALCPCETPPVTFGFRSAIVAPPTDLVLEQPTVRVYGVPVFWLPYLWLRSPVRMGLLPLELSLRGHDGFVAGAGVHLPVGDSFVDLRGAAYLEGGADLRARLETPRTSTEVRWDHIGGRTLLAVDARGSVVHGSSGGAAFSVDSLSGARALSGPAELEEVALRQDRARAAAGVAHGPLTVAFVASRDVRRGAPFETAGVAGPGAHVGIGTALATGVTFDADADVATLRVSEGDATTLLLHRGELRAVGSAGPVVASLSGRSRVRAAWTAESESRTLLAGLGARLEAPFVKEFGTDAAVEHWVVPFTDAFVGVGRVEGDGDRATAIVPGTGRLYTAAAGVRSTLGETAGRRSAVRAEISAGALGDFAERPSGIVQAHLEGRAHAGAVRATGLATERSADGAERALLALGELRLGPEDGPFVGGHAEGTRGNASPASRLLVDGFDGPWDGWLAREGWTVGGSGGVPFTRWLSALAGADYDLTRNELLGIRGSLGYRHPAGCLAITLWGGARVGRPGVDSWVTVDLMP